MCSSVERERVLARNILAPWARARITFVAGHRGSCHLNPPDPFYTAFSFASFCVPELVDFSARGCALGPPFLLSTWITARHVRSSSGSWLQAGHTSTMFHGEAKFAEWSARKEIEPTPRSSLDRISPSSSLDFVGERSEKFINHNYMTIELDIFLTLDSASRNNLGKLAQWTLVEIFP